MRMEGGGWAEQIVGDWVAWLLLLSRYVGCLALPFSFVRLRSTCVMGAVARYVGVVSIGSTFRSYVLQNDEVSARACSGCSCEF